MSHVKRKSQGFFNSFKSLITDLLSKSLDVVIFFFTRMATDYLLSMHDMVGVMIYL